MADPTEQEVIQRLTKLAEEQEALLEAGRKRFKGFEEQWGDVDKVPALIQLRKTYDDKIAELETRLNRGGLGGGAGDPHEETRAAFKRWMRGKDKPEDMRALQTDDETKGGLLVPQPIRQAMLKKLVEISPIRANAGPAITISRGDSVEIPEETGEFTAEWTGQRKTRNETNTPTYGMHRLQLREQSAFPKATQNMLDDNEFDLEGYIATGLAQAFAKAENLAFLKGDGVTQPEGILGNADVPQVVSGSAASITADGMLNLIYEIKTQHTSGMSVFLNRKTVLALRKLKDSNGQYLWQPSLQAGMPATFSGVPLIETPDMDEIAAGKLVALAGNLRNGYVIGDKSTMGMVRDPYTDKPKVGFYTTRRVAGIVARPEALAIMEVSA